MKEISIQQAVTENRIGRFKVTSGMLNEYPTTVHQFTSKVLVNGCVLTIDSKILIYTGYCGLFESINEGPDIPNYEIVLSQVLSGEINFSVRRSPIEPPQLTAHEIISKFSC